MLVSGTLTNATTVRIEPPLVISMEQLTEVMHRLEEAVVDADAWLRAGGKEELDEDEITRGAPKVNPIGE